MKLPSLPSAPTFGKFVLMFIAAGAAVKIAKPILQPLTSKLPAAVQNLLP